ncbi:MAG: hypothetical protein CMH34_02375 [Microbacterium sp.]|nr:hypothetical protein [Microbacterium sp.]
MSIETDVRRALRWHSSRWRKNHETVLTGMYLDMADSEGWAELPARERRALRRSGLAERLRWITPAILGAIVIAAGISALVLPPLPNLYGAAMWVIVGPVALALATVSLLSTLEGYVSRSDFAVGAVAVLAAVTLSATWWVATYRDLALTAGTYVPVAWFWAFGAAYALIFSSAVSLAATRRLGDHGLPAPAAAALSVLGGLVSAVLFAGVALIPFLQIGAGIAIMSLSIAGRRRVNAPRRRSNFA